MQNARHAIKRRSDYQSPAYVIQHVELDIDLYPHETRVICTTQVERKSADQQPLVLDGVDLQLLSVRVNGADWTNYVEKEQTLVVDGLPDAFTLTIETQIDPANNSSLEGLYKSGDAYCTQCEAEGFRKITYFLDRPDIMAEYRVTVRGNKSAYPYLLSNGNVVAKGELDDGRHFVTWHDPFPKPCYLFALVAGDFDLLSDNFVTASGREVALELYVDKGKRERGYHALDSLKRAMAWDEQTFGLEYDLDIYMIVAVDFFNMGAMENKGLNVFNSKYVLADGQSATDDDYFHIESVIAHEYFHNWTGNRVTCRDWFQLSLKEGLTVFRDQQFSADMASPLVNRINQVNVMREHQFAEDAGPMSHPIRPDVVMEMNNFYTVTVYDKGAEVIRMLHTLLGVQGFRRGMDLYFERHDGQAVTCDDFVQAMQDANQHDLTLFKRWYSQSGTPVVRASGEYDQQARQFKLTLTQHTPATADQAEKQPLMIPVNTELLGNQGTMVQTVLSLTQAQQTFVFDNIDQAPVMSLLGNFSAPVRLYDGQNSSARQHIVMYANDPFSRWDAMQTLYGDYLHCQAGSAGEFAEPISTAGIVELQRSLLNQAMDSPALVAEMLCLPSFETLVQQAEQIDVDALFDARNALLNQLAEALEQDMLAVVQQLPAQAYDYQQNQVEQRRLRNVLWLYLGRLDQHQAALKSHYHDADNMTDCLGALRAAQEGNEQTFDQLMVAFEQRWQDDPLVLDKWFGLHASAPRKDCLSRLDLLSGHKQFSLNNPNRVRALLGSFAFYNPKGFHAKDGSGYRYLTDYLKRIDPINPQVAARLVTPLTQFRHLDSERKSLIETQLHRLLDTPNLSGDVFEKVSKALGIQSQP
ncbi:aminopeptidase N [Aestuariibacter halophilus]|uniref:Aminopeptidase N n=1 Tax=Fluctibacter halophilus TaxID=226011 RepID=A0ABS8G7L7_9ALTE|nr:aminopeptidase N [Aestuariibacter halophilus]MCC2615669.1 aminopeptidase N [Aestuariibacter halophilus]